ncbi:MAG TPA: hypothetical protein VGN52_17280 [Burkholderiales bacterium]
MQVANQTAPARSANDEAPATAAPQPGQHRLPLATRSQDLFKSLHHAQAAFSTCLNRYIEL